VPNAADVIKQAASMYHQFKQLADLDITTTPMEVGPTTHYTRAGFAWTATRRCPRCPASCRRRSALAGANRLGGNSLGSGRPRQARGRYAAQCEGEQVADRRRAGEGGIGEGRWRRSSAARRVNPYTVQSDLQAMMQDLVGIVRLELR
jgi:succinate dehydrogenase / fumarate reductase flavoprotein subunit